MTAGRISIPDKLGWVFAPPRGELRHRGAFGGRGSGKSMSFAKMAAAFGYVEPLRILCTREYDVSIKESFHAELKHAIAEEPWLSVHYDVGVDYLRGSNGTEFIFRGLRRNMSAIKSMAKIDICIVEEAEDVPENSWVDLEPTIRADGSEIWPIWNPRVDGSPVDRRYRKHPPPRARIVQLNYTDNAAFPAVLDELRRHALATLDYATYCHIWHGAYWQATAAQIFRGKFTVTEFNTPPDVERFYFGADWGFSTDPATLIRFFIRDNCLFVDYEAYKAGVEIDNLPGFWEEVPEARRWPIKADNSRPEMISMMCRRGFKVAGAMKWAGAVEDGIEYLRNFKQIYIHPRCTGTAKEFLFYSYKTDKTTGEVLPIIIDAFNHAIDAIRYGLDGYIKPPNTVTGMKVKGL